ncbi:hypothetical protein O5476_02295 [Escherichia coli]|nr:hypothetical protein [Escherichia coli]
MSNLMVNGNRISNSWYAALARYNPLIRGASDGLTSNIEGFLNGGNFKKILTEAGEGLEKLGKWLNSEQFKNDLDDFSLAVSRIAKAIWSAIKWIGGEINISPEPELVLNRQIQFLRHLGINISVVRCREQTR